MPARRAPSASSYVIDVAVKHESAFRARHDGTGWSEAPDLAYRSVKPGKAPLRHRPVIVGSGPAGLFAALTLARMDYRPLVLERGKAVAERRRDIARFWSAGDLSPESNLHFGEGGAGTFSDGKLATTIHDTRCRKVLEELVSAGASDDILFQAKPHLGSDCLPAIVKRIGETIAALGGEVRFDSLVTGLRADHERHHRRRGGRPGPRRNAGGDRRAGEQRPRHVHDAVSAGVEMQAKPFSIGVRVEHPQQLIDRAQVRRRRGASAPGGRGLQGVLSRAQRPIGLLVLHVSRRARRGIGHRGERRVHERHEPRSARDRPNANSALLVGVTPADYPSEHPLAGIEFQRQWERLAFAAGGGDYGAPLQLVGDFLKRRPSITLGTVQPSYSPAGRLADLAACLPDYVIDTLRLALRAFGQRLAGFDAADAVLTGVETRSSSPVRIARGESFEASLRGLYPAGEGAGYAGGIMSSAVDGIRVAEAVIRQVRAAVIARSFPLAVSPTVPRRRRRRADRPHPIRSIESQPWHA